MLYYLQFRPDKKEPWHLVDESQMDKLPKPPSYISVLAVDKDVDAVIEAEGIALDEVKYRGPMYFDLDNTDNIDAVLDSTRELIHKLNVLYEIPSDYIHCWLSGGKGVHITIPAEIFGLTRAVKHLPHIYKLIAETVKVADLDMSVYSASRGRLWRCEHVPRPGSGTYKVSVTPEELETMDAEEYQRLVSEDRDSLPIEYPSKNLAFIKAQEAFKVARQSAKKYVESLKNAKVIPKERIAQLEETPGCIEKLIKVGDCAESTWNQAAMQVAAWIAARYTKEQEDLFRMEVVEPFLENVTSSSRNEMERRKHLLSQINRAFSGRTRFLVGPLIATLGEPCHACPLCRGDMDFDEDPESSDEPFDPVNKIKASKSGYQMILNDKPRQVTTFTFEVEYEARESEIDEHSGEFKETERREMIGTLTDCLGDKFYGVRIPEDAWTNKTAMNKAVAGHGSAKVIGNDVELTYVSLAILRWMKKRAEENGDIEVVTNTRVCGIHMDKVGPGSYIPTYVESGASVCATRADGDGPRKLQGSRFKFQGRSSTSPQLVDTPYPYEDDEELRVALHHLFRVNRIENVGRITGWMCATFLKEHIYLNIPQFPLLQVWGNAGAGKTMSLLLFLHLTGMDYQSRSEPLNVETTTAYPLGEFVTTSTTVPRLIEEVNETNVSRQMYQRILGLFKAAWNRSTAARGRLGKNGAESEDRRVSSPICYVSEQRSQRSSLRNRTVEVMLSAKDREEPGRSDHFRTAYAHREALHRAAKAMLHRSLILSPADVQEMMDRNEELVDPSMDARPRFSMLTILMGLDFLRDSLKACNINIDEDIEMVKQGLCSYLSNNHQALEQERRVTEVDQVLKAMDQMAAEPDDSSIGLKVDRHYYRVGRKLFLNLGQCHSRYRRWARGVGEVPVISQAAQMAELLEGEVFFERKTEDEDNPDILLHVLNLDKLEERGMKLPNFQETSRAG